MNSTPLLAILLVLVSIPSFLAEEERDLGPCLYQDSETGRKYGGRCRKLRNCNSSLSDIRAEILPQFQQCANKPRGPGEKIVCCRTMPRESELRCQEYEGIRKLRRSALAVMNSYTEDRIIGGRDAQDEEYPYLVLIGYEDKEEPLWGCGGILISEDFVLTAAHCVDTKFGPPKRILAGDIVAERPTVPKNSMRKVVPVARAIVHPSYSKKTKYHDIALVKLARKMIWNSAIAPICLPSPKARLEQDANVTVAGWGLTEVGGEEKMSNILKSATLDRFSHDECLHYCNHPDRRKRVCNAPMLRSQFCAGDKSKGTGEKKDTCKGDSGGPVIASRTEGDDVIKYVVGLTSFGPRICGSGIPGFYTNVHSYLSWIEKTIWPLRQ